MAKQWTKASQYVRDYFSFFKKYTLFKSLQPSDAVDSPALESLSQADDAPAAVSSAAVAAAPQTLQPQPTAPVRSIVPNLMNYVSDSKRRALGFKYGFLLETNRAHEREKEKEWMKMFEEFGHGPDLVRSPKFRRFVKHGIPNRLRGEIWDISYVLVFFLFIFKKEKRVGLGGPKKKKSDYIIHYSMNIAPKKVLVN